MSDQQQPVKATIQAFVGTCREWVGTDRCGQHSEYILWGKLIPAEGLGPRCYDHAAKHVGHVALYPGTDYALVHIGDLARVLTAHPAAHEDHDAR